MPCSPPARVSDVEPRERTLHNQKLTIRRAERLPDDADDQHRRASGEARPEVASVQRSPRDDARLARSAVARSRWTHGQHKEQLHRADPGDLVLRMVRKLA